MGRPLVTGLSLLLVFSTAAAGRADAQSLGEAARKAQEQRKTAPASRVYDARDIKPDAVVSRPPAEPPVATAPVASAPVVAAPPASAPSTGVSVPDFTFVDFTGGTRRLSDYRGRYVLLDFWGVWCPNCRAEVPHLKAAYAQFQSRGLEIIGMDYERGATFEDVRQYLSVNGVNWTFARADSVRDVIKQQFQIDAFPTLMLVDPSGALVDTSSQSLRGARLAKTLDKLLPK